MAGNQTDNIYIASPVLYLLRQQAISVTAEQTINYT